MFKLIAARRSRRISPATEDENLFIQGILGQLHSSAVECAREGLYIQAPDRYRSSRIFAAIANAVEGPVLIIVSHHGVIPRINDELKELGNATPLLKWADASRSKPASLMWARHDEIRTASPTQLASIRTVVIDDVHFVLTPPQIDLLSKFPNALQIGAAFSAPLGRAESTHVCPGLVSARSFQQAARHGYQIDPLALNEAERRDWITLTARYLSPDRLASITAAFREARQDDLAYRMAFEVLKLLGNEPLRIAAVRALSEMGRLMTYYAAVPDVIQLLDFHHPSTQFMVRQLIHQVASVPKSGRGGISTDFIHYLITSVRLTDDELVKLLSADHTLSATQQADLLKLWRRFEVELLEKTLPMNLQAKKINALSNQIAGRFSGQSALARFFAFHELRRIMTDAYGRVTDFVHKSDLHSCLFPVEGYIRDEIHRLRQGRDHDTYLSILLAVNKVLDHDRDPMAPISPLLAEISAQWDAEIEKQRQAPPSPAQAPRSPQVRQPSSPVRQPSPPVSPAQHGRTRRKTPMVIDALVGLSDIKLKMDCWVEKNAGFIEIPVVYAHRLKDSAVKQGKMHLNLKDAQPLLFVIVDESKKELMRSTKPEDIRTEYAQAAESVPTQRSANGLINLIHLMSPGSSGEDRLRQYRMRSDGVWELRITEDDLILLPDSTLQKFKKYLELPKTTKVRVVVLDSRGEVIEEDTSVNLLLSHYLKRVAQSGAPLPVKPVKVSRVRDGVRQNIIDVRSVEDGIDVLVDPASLFLLRGEQRAMLRQDLGVGKSRKMYFVVIQDGEEVDRHTDIKHLRKQFPEEFTY